MVPLNVKEFAVMVIQIHDHLISAFIVNHNALNMKYTRSAT